MKNTQTVEYLGREMDAVFEVSQPDYNHNYPGEIELTAVIYNGRNIINLIDKENIEDALYQGNLPLVLNLGY